MAKNAIANKSLFDNNEEKLHKRQDFFYINKDSFLLL